MPRAYLTEAQREQAKEDRRLKTISEWVALSRHRTQREDKETALLVGVSPVTFCRWKSNVPRDIPLRKVLRIIQYCGVPPEESAKLLQ